jgi:predicted house-cleaning NTP pyrophosphatase (Maf/HAM1 superfamily)
MILEHLGKLQDARIVLASGSPRRLEILNDILKLCAEFP